MKRSFVLVCLLGCTAGTIDTTPEQTATSPALLPFTAWQEVPGGGTTVVADAATSLGDKLYLFGIGINDHHHYVNVLQGTQWSGWSPLPGSGTTLLPDGAVTYHDKIHLFGIGIGDHQHYLNTFDGTSWSGWSPVPGSLATAQPDAAAVYQDSLYLFAIGMDHAHYVNRFGGAGWSGWSVVPGGGTTVVADSATAYAGKLYLFGIGTNDHGQYMNVFDGTRWTGWSPIAGGHTTLSDASAVLNGQLYLFSVSDTDHQHFVNAFNGSTWSGWTLIPGGPVGGAADAVAVYKLGLYVFAIGASDHRHYFTRAVDLPRYNQVFRKAEHNAFWVDASSATADSYAAGTQQRVLDQALFEHGRAFEFDIHYKLSHPGEFDVYHTDNQDNSTCYSLEDCLELMRRIDYVLPNHEVINIVVELKEIALPTFGNLAGQDHHPADLDRLVWERLGSRLYTPREFLERCPAGYTLHDCARDYGWPTIDELRGRYILNVIGNYFRNDESYRNYTDDDGGVINRAGFPLRSVFDATRDTLGSCPGDCWTRLQSEIFWQVENTGKPDVPGFLANGGVVRSGGAHMISDPIPSGLEDNIGKISQTEAMQRGFQLIMTDYPWNFIEDAHLYAPQYVPSAADRPFFQPSDAMNVPQIWDPSLLREPGGRILFDTAPRVVQWDRLPGNDGTLENAPEKAGYAEAFLDAQRAFPNATWEVFPSTTADSHSAGPLNNGHPGVGCFFARSSDAQNELRICRIAQMNGGRDVTVHVTIREQGVLTYDDSTNVHKNVVEGLGDAFRIVLVQSGPRTRISLMTGNAVLPDGTMGWIQHPVNTARGNGAVFYVNGALTKQGLSATNEAIFTGTTLNGQPVALAQLQQNGARIRDLSFCLDGSCRHLTRPSHETTRRQGGAIWVGVHETEGRVFGQWRTLYTTDRFEVTNSGLGQVPVFEKFELNRYAGTNLVPLYRCVDWRRDYHQHWLSTDGTCPNPNTKEAFAQSAGIMGFISTVQQPGMAPLWHLRKGTQNAGSADTHDHYFAVGDAQRDTKQNNEGYSLVGTTPVGYVYTPATLPSP